MDQLRTQLAACARDVFVNCSGGVWRSPLAVAVDPFWWREPGHIASFVSFGVDALVEAWSPLLAKANLEVRITGVFCHQSPKVAMISSAGVIPPPGECELGDLLIVHEHEVGAVRKRRAILLQAKMLTGGGAANANQEFLYEHWPDFSIKRPGVFDSRARDVRDNTDGGKYLLIHEPPWGQSPWDIQAGSRTGPIESFADALVRMLDYDGAADRGRVADKTGDGWSELVDDLLKQLHLRTFAEKGLLGPGVKAHRIIEATSSASLVAYAGIQPEPVWYVTSGSSSFVGVGTGGGAEGPEDVETEEFAPSGRAILIQTSLKPDS